MITYNQCNYIQQAVESALNQQTDFEYEIVIGDDYSTDGTRVILQALQRTHPERIKLLLHEQNLGLEGKRNLVATLKSC